MTRHQTELDNRWHDTGYEELGIGFAHEPLSPTAALGTAKGIIAEMTEWNCPQCERIYYGEDAVISRLEYESTGKCFFDCPNESHTLNLLTPVLRAMASTEKRT